VGSAGHGIETTLFGCFSARRLSIHTHTNILGPPWRARHLIRCPSSVSRNTPVSTNDHPDKHSLPLTRERWFSPALVLWLPVLVESESSVLQYSSMRAFFQRMLQQQMAALWPGSQLRVRFDLQHTKLDRLHHEQGSALVSKVAPTSPSTVSPRVFVH
jgi:hypothetical protein